MKRFRNIYVLIILVLCPCGLSGWEGFVGHELGTVVSPGKNEVAASRDLLDDDVFGKILDHASFGGIIQFEATREIPDDDTFGGMVQVDAARKIRVASDTSRIRIPLSRKKALLAMDPEIYRENVQQDSVDLLIDLNDLSVYQSIYPNLRILKAAPLLDASDMAKTMAEAMDFQKYPTYPQYDSMMHHFANTYPSICRIDTFGTSVEGRLLLALKISDNVDQEEDEPTFLYTATMHGDELVGYVLCLRLADFLLSNYGSDVEVDRIINDVELWINPLSNPDGTFYPDNDATVQASIRENVNGINLNRNFPDPKSGEEDDPSGRQPETQQMMKFMHQIRPDLSANIHAGAEVVNYPWDHKYERHPDTDWYILISQEYADEAKAIKSSYLNLYPSGITNGADWYRIYGGRQDYVNYYLHGREVTLELSNIKRLESEYLDDFWNYNQWSLVNLITQSRYGIHGNVTGFGNRPLEAVITVMEHDNDSSWIVSDPFTGNFYRYLKEGTYDLVISAQGYDSDTIYDVKVMDYQKTSLQVQLDSLGASLPKHTGIQFRLYPNPAGEQVQIISDHPFSKGSTIVISDISGKIILTMEAPAGTTRFTVDVSGLKPGICLVQIKGTGHSRSHLLYIR